MSESEVLSHRSAAQRQHRLLGLYASLFCWVNGEEGCFVPRETLVSLLGLQRFKGARIDWMRNDLSAYFQHIKWAADENTDQFLGVYLCRRSEEETREVFDYEWSELPSLSIGLSSTGQPVDTGSIFAASEHYLVGVIGLLGLGALAPSDIPGFLLTGDDEEAAGA